MCGLPIGEHEPCNHPMAGIVILVIALSILYGMWYVLSVIGNCVWALF